MYLNLIILLILLILNELVNDGDIGAELTEDDVRDILILASRLIKDKFDEFNDM